MAYKRVTAEERTPPTAGDLQHVYADARLAGRCGSAFPRHSLNPFKPNKARWGKPSVDACGAELNPATVATAALLIEWGMLNHVQIVLSTSSRCAYSLTVVCTRRETSTVKGNGKETNEYPTRTATKNI